MKTYGENIAIFLCRSRNHRLVLKSETIDRMTGAHMGDGVTIVFTDSVGHIDNKIKVNGKGAAAAALEHPRYGEDFWAHPQDPNGFWKEHEDKFPPETLFPGKGDEQGGKVLSEVMLEARKHMILTKTIVNEIYPAIHGEDGRPIIPVLSDGRMMPTDSQLSPEALAGIGKTVEDVA